MADYIFEVPLSNEGRDIVTEPDVVDSIIIEGSYMISAVTDNNLTVDTVSVDAETKRVYYDVTASPVMKAGLAIGDLAWYNTLLSGVAIAGAVVCVIVYGWPAAIPAAVVVGVALAYDAVTGYIEVEATKANVEQQIAQAVIDGKITPEEGDNLLDGVKQGWGTDIPWTTIIIGGMVGIGALAALYIFLKRPPPKQ